MNTNQIMPSANKVQVSRKMTATRGNSGNKNGSFDDFMAKSKTRDGKDSLTLQDVKDLAKNAEAAEKEAKLAKAAESVGTEANAPKENKAEGNTDAENSNQKDAVKETTDISENSDASLAAQNATLANAIANALTTEENEAQVDAAIDTESDASIKAGDFVVSVKTVKTEITAEFTNVNFNDNTKEPNFNLETILPQGDMGKHKEMLAMLSRQHIPRGEGKIDLNNFELVKPEPLKNPDMPAFMQEKPADPLSLMANEMAKIGKMAENAMDKAPEFSNAKMSLGDARDMPIMQNTQNMPKNDELGSKILDNFRNFVDNKDESALKDFGVNAKDIPIDTKSALKEMPAKMQATPINPQLLNAKTDNTQTNPVFAGVDIEVEDADVLPVRQFGNFGQSSNSEEQSLFNRGQEEMIRPDNATKAVETKVEGAPQFAHALESQNQTSATKEAAPTTALPRDNFDVRGQIVEQARMIRAENGTEMVIRLKPEHLGDLTLRISVTSEGSVTASFFTNNSEVRHIVENSLVQLRQELQNQGLKVDKTEVYSGLSDGNLPQGNGQEAWQQNQSGNSSNSSNGSFRSAESGALEFEDVSNGTASSSSSNNNLTDEGVDYLV